MSHAALLGSLEQAMDSVSDAVPMAMLHARPSPCVRSASETCALADTSSARWQSDDAIEAAAELSDAHGVEPTGAPKRPIRVV